MDQINIFFGFLLFLVLFTILRLKLNENENENFNPNISESSNNINNNPINPINPYLPTNEILEFDSQPQQTSLGKLIKANNQKNENKNQDIKKFSIMDRTANLIEKKVDLLNEKLDRLDQKVDHVEIKKIQPITFDQITKKAKTEKEKENVYFVGCNTDEDCNTVNGNGQNVCKMDHKCHCQVSG